jgi:hypothetical protein
MRRVELEQEDQNANEEPEEHGLSNVMLARRSAQIGDIDQLRYLLDNNLISAGATDSDDCSLLHWASINNRIDVSLRGLIGNQIFESFR